MKKVFESELRGFDESATKIYVFELESPEECDEVWEMDHKEMCDLVGVFDEDGYDVMPGAIYHTYEFTKCGGFLVMQECVALNV